MRSFLVQPSETREHKFGFEWEKIPSNPNTRKNFGRNVLYSEHGYFPWLLQININWDHFLSEQPILGFMWRTNYVPNLASFTPGRCGFIDAVCTTILHQDEFKYVWYIIWVHRYKYFTCQPLLILPKRSNWIMLTPVILSWSSSIEKLAKLTEINYFQDQWMCKKCTKFYTFFAMFL